MTIRYPGAWVLHSSLIRRFVILIDAWSFPSLGPVIPRLAKRAEGSRAGCWTERGELSKPRAPREIPRRLRGLGMTVGV